MLLRQFSEDLWKKNINNLAINKQYTRRVELNYEFKLKYNVMCCDVYNVLKI